MKVPPALTFIEPVALTYAGFVAQVETSLSATSWEPEAGVIGAPVESS